MTTRPLPSPAIADARRFGCVQRRFAKNPSIIRDLPGLPEASARVNPGITAEIKPLQQPLPEVPAWLG